MHITQSLHKSLLQCPQACATVFLGRRQTFAGLVDRVSRLASVLKAQGLQPGDRVGMLALNSDRYVEFLYAVWWAGGVVNPVNIRWSAKEIAYSLDDCDTRLLLVDRHYAAQVAGLVDLSKSLRFVGHVTLADGEPVPAGLFDIEAAMAAATPVRDAMRGNADLAAVLYTGGTTGLPKGVMLTHTNLYVNSLCANLAAARPRNAIGVQTAPMFHVGGIGLMLQLMGRLARQVILPAFDEVAVLTAISEEGGNETFLVPTMLKRVIEHPRFGEFDVSGLELVLYGSAPIDDALLVQAIAALPNAGFVQLYGMTELSPVVTVLPAWCHEEGQPARRRRSAGQPVPIAEIRIVDRAGVPLPQGETGEIAVRGPMVMAGYWNKPGQTAEVLRDGWMHTGDAGCFDADNFLFVVDRLKDMVVTGGENVYSAEVENAIAQLPQVSMCAVIGIPNDQWGETVHAVVVTRPGHTLTTAEIDAHCRREIAGYKCPRSVEFRDEMPLSAAGKLLKYKLREPHWAGRERKV